MATKLVKSKDEEEEEILRQENNRRVDDALKNVSALREKSEEERDKSERCKRALESIHRMEWLKNKDDSATLQKLRRIQPLGVLVPIQKKEEEDYFSGTGKTAKPRGRKRERMEIPVCRNLQDLSTTAEIPPPPPRNAPPPPPPINAWSQKPGSALFRGSTAATFRTYGLEYYNEQAMLEKAIQESLKEQEEDINNPENFANFSHVKDESCRFERGAVSRRGRFPMDNVRSHRQSSDAEKSEINRQKFFSEKVCNGSSGDKDGETDYYQKGKELAELRAREREKARLASAKEKKQKAEIENKLFKSIEPERSPRRTTRQSPDQPSDRQTADESLTRQVRFSPEPQVVTAKSWEDKETVEQFPDISEEKRQIGTTEDVADAVEQSPVMHVDQRQIWTPKDTEGTVSFHDIQPDSTVLPQTPTYEDKAPTVIDAATERQYSPYDYILTEETDTSPSPVSSMDQLESHSMTYPHPIQYSYGDCSGMNTAFPGDNIPQYIYPNIAPEVEGGMYVASPYHQPSGATFTSSVQPDRQYSETQGYPVQKNYPGGGIASAAAAPTHPEPSGSLQESFQGLQLGDMNNLDTRFLQLSLVLNQYFHNRFRGSLSAGDTALEALSTLIPQLPAVPQTPDDVIKAMPPPPPIPGLPWAMTEGPNSAQPTFQYPTSLPPTSDYPQSPPQVYTQVYSQPPPSHNFIRAPLGRGRGALPSHT